MSIWYYSKTIHFGKLVFQLSARQLGNVYSYSRWQDEREWKLIFIKLAGWRRWVCVEFTLVEGCFALWKNFRSLGRQISFVLPVVCSLFQLMPENLQPKFRMQITVIVFSSLSRPPIYFNFPYYGGLNDSIACWFCKFVTTATRLWVVKWNWVNVFFFFLKIPANILPWVMMNCYRCFKFFKILPFIYRWFSIFIRKLMLSQFE